MTFTLFFPGNNNWMNVMIPVEILGSGLINSGNVQCMMFTPSIYNNNGSVLVTDSLRIIFIVILLFFFGIDIKERFLNYPSITDIITYKQLLTLFIFVVYLASFIMKQLYLTGDDSSFFPPFRGDLPRQLHNCLLLPTNILRGMSPL